MFETENVVVCVVEVVGDCEEVVTVVGLRGVGRGVVERDEGVGMGLDDGLALF